MGIEFLKRIPSNKRKACITVFLIAGLLSVMACYLYFQFKDKEQIDFIRDFIWSFAKSDRNYLVKDKLNDKSITGKADEFENPDNKPNIDVQTAVTLSSNDMFPINGRHECLKLKLVEGKYRENWTPGPVMGTIWEGRFIWEVNDEAGNIISQTDLPDIGGSSNLAFTSSFGLEFDDYNGDGDPDFTLGQYASSNGRVYRIFTLRKNGKVEELTVKGHPEIFITNSTGYYSTRLAKTDKYCFKTEYYDNSVPGYFYNIYKWDRDGFVFVSRRELDYALNRKIYANMEYHASFEYPSNWRLNSSYFTDRYEGRTNADYGFFHIGAVGVISGKGGLSIDATARLDADHKLKPYGTAPRIEKLKIQGQEARLIMASDDQPEEMDKQCVLIVEYPVPVEVGGSTYRYFKLWADKNHIEEIAESLKFIY